MFERLFSRASHDAAPLPEPDARLALGALLVRVALADRSYKASEIGRIDRILSATFDLKPLEAARLRAQCEELERHAPGTPEFARILCEQVDYARRKAVAVALWDVALADGERVGAEENLIHAIETALGLSSEDIAEVRAAALRRE